MYLSKCAVRPADVRNPYLVHKAIWTLFPDMPEADRPFLYRLDPARRGRDVSVLLQSECEPAPVADSRCRLIAGPKPMRLTLGAGQTLRFAVCANPTKRLSKQRCRVPLIDEDELHQWLAGKLAGAAEVLESQIVGRRHLHFRKGSRCGKVVAVTFAGALTVSDPDRLVDVVRHGIGPAKSFGCGLLSLARL